MGDELVSGVVFRLANVKRDFPPDSLKLQPSHLGFSEGDRQEAADKKTAPYLSVFDIAKCTVGQARIIRPSENQANGYGFEIEKILAIQVGGLPNLKLSVIPVPLDPPKSELPGAIGHCGFFGLQRPEGLPNGKNLYSALRTKVADCSFRLDDQS